MKHFTLHQNKKAIHKRKYLRLDTDFETSNLNNWKKNHFQHL